jgi:hypothetical protein
LRSLSRHPKYILSSSPEPRYAETVLVVVGTDLSKGQILLSNQSDHSDASADGLGVSSSLETATGKKTTGNLVLLLARIDGRL